jgi:hypothetical protein
MGENTYKAFIFTHPLAEIETSVGTWETAESVPFAAGRVFKVRALGVRGPLFGKRKPLAKETR